MNDSILTKNTIELYDEGLSVLIRNMGLVRAKQFISTLSREEFDYTKWHQAMVDEITPEKFSKLVEEYEQTHRPTP